MGVLDGKVALISGTAAGQGRAAALAFAKAGARVFGCDVNEDGDRETVELVRAAGGVMESLAPLDPSDMKEAERWAKAANDTFGGIDILYNNASKLVAVGPFGESTLEQWEGSLRYELTIVYTSTRAVWPYLVARGGGAIVSIASFCGHIEAQPFRSAAHGACNAGVSAFARMLAAEGAEHNIRSNSISPGLIETEASKAMYDKEVELARTLKQKVPSNKFGQPREIADVALFLASDAASYVNGADFIVDGGMCVISTDKVAP